jgi:hypothetical protein
MARTINTPPSYDKLHDISTPVLYHIQHTIEEFYNGRHPGRPLEDIVSQQLRDHFGIKLNKIDLETFIDALTLKIS